MKSFYQFLFFLIAFYGYAPVAVGQVQWASQVLGVSSEYEVEKLSLQYKAIQALGKPNKLPAVGNSPCAWSPAKPDGRADEWIKVGYAAPMQIQQIGVAESFNAGAICAIYLYDTENREYLVYKNLDNQAMKEIGRMTRVFMPLTPYLVSAVKIVLTPLDVEGWNHIDAIGISNIETPIEATINVPKANPEEPKTIVREDLGSLINTQFEEILPVISTDGKTLYFDRKNHPLNTPTFDSLMHPVINDDIWYTTLGIDGRWKQPRRMLPPLNNESHNYVCAVTPDGNTLLLGNRYLAGKKSMGGVSMSRRVSGEDRWAFPEALQVRKYYSLNHYSEFALSANQKILLLAIERVDSYGSRDIYMSMVQSDGTWSEPKNLGNTINTAAAEITPFLAADNKTLYFSSSGFSGFGETDMFMSRRLDDTWTAWSEPVNLGIGLNSTEWDASYTIDGAGEYAYFVSYHNSNSQSADIFRAKLPQAVKPEPVAFLSGRVFDAKTKEPLAAKIIYETLPEGIEAGFANANPNTGEYQIVLPFKNTYGLRAEAEGFIAIHENLDLKMTNNLIEIKKDLYLAPIEVGQMIRLNNVFFEQGKPNLTADSYPELDRLLKTMQESVAMEIQLEGHTDIEGSPAANLKLSLERVKAIQQYLVEGGIAEKRIILQAFGEAHPLTRLRDEKSKQQNRRVEVKVLKK